MFHITLFFTYPYYFKILMLLHSSRNLKLEYNYDQPFHPFTLENLENFFKLEIFGIKLLYLNRRFTLIYFYKNNTSFLPEGFTILEEPENLKLEQVKIWPYYFCHHDADDIHDFFPATSPFSPRCPVPQSGLIQYTRFTILGLSQQVVYQGKMILFQFPIECSNLFKLYFQSIEKILIDLQILNKVTAKVVHASDTFPYLSTDLIISQNGDNFDFKPFENFISITPFEDYSPRPFTCFLNFTDSDAFFKIFNYST